MNKEKKINMFSSLKLAAEKIGVVLAKDQKLTRLVVDMSEDPLSEEKPNINWIDDLSYKNFIKNTPLAVADDIKQGEIHILPNIGFSGANDEFVTILFQFDIICPLVNWDMKGSVRPIEIMERIYEHCDDKRVTGIGVLSFTSFELTTVDDLIGTYSMSFTVDSFSG